MESFGWVPLGQLWILYTTRDNRSKSLECSAVHFGVVCCFTRWVRRTLYLVHLYTGPCCGAHCTLLHACWLTRTTEQCDRITHFGLHNTDTALQRLGSHNTAAMWHAFGPQNAATLKHVWTTQQWTVLHKFGPSSTATFVSQRNLWWLYDDWTIKYCNFISHFWTAEIDFV
jgi:hypothetical protein